MYGLVYIKLMIVSKSGFDISQKYGLWALWMHGTIFERERINKSSAHTPRKRERARDSYAYLYRPLIVPVRKSFTRNRTVAKQFRATKSLSGNCCLFICNSTRERSQHEATTTAMKGAKILLCNWNEIHSGKIEIKSNKSQWHFANYAVNHGEKWDKHENYWS